jgi:lysophospholipase L1-like esterase
VLRLEIITRDCCEKDEGAKAVKKRILCFGDSNTWGYNAITKERFEDNERWTGVLQIELGDGYTVLEEGLNGRTTVWDDPIELHKNGYKQIFPIMESQKPFEMMIIMLGTNDLKRRFNVSARDIAQSAALLAMEAMRSGCGHDGRNPIVLLAAPIEIGADFKNGWLAELFETDCVARSRQFAYWYAEFAHELGCHFINSGEYAKPDTIDFIHIPPEGHRSLGLAMASTVRSIL